MCPSGSLPAKAGENSSMIHRAGGRPGSTSVQCGSNTCIWDESLKASDCDKAGTKDEFQSCASYNDCKQGLACTLHPVFGNECERWCRIGFDFEDCGLFDCDDVYGNDAPFQGANKMGLCR